MSEWAMVQPYHGIVFGGLKKWGRTICTHMEMFLSEKKLQDDIQIMMPFA